MSTYQSNLATVEEPYEFLLPTTDISTDFSHDDLAEDMDGLQMRFPRVKIPTGGALQFEVPGDDPEVPDYARSLEGVILYHHPNNGYWPGGMGDEEKNPLCASVDGKTGIGDPGGPCASCSLNRFGSGEDGRGKACKNMRAIYLLRSGDFMPLMLSLSPTSLRPFNDFMNAAFLTRRRASYGSVVQISLKRMNNGKDDYSVAVFRKLYDFSGEQLAQIKAYATNFREQAHIMLDDRARAAESQKDDGCDYDGFSDKQDGADGHFVIGKTIDGGKDELPL